MDTFLEMTKHTEGCDIGNGLCENLVRCSRVSVLDRKLCNDYVKNEASNDNKFSLNSEDMSVSSDAGTGLSGMSKSEIDEINAHVFNRTCRRSHKLK